MEGSAFLTARQMAQELVRSRVEPADVAQLLSYMQENKSGAAFFAHLQESSSATGENGQEATPLLQVLETHLRPLQDKPEDMIDVLGWGVAFMRYYRGEGNRPRSDQHPSQPRPQRAPRQAREVREPSIALESLQPGQLLQGKIRSVTPYGMFVDVGAERDGLVHISEMSEEYKGESTEPINMGESIDVWVKSVDAEKKRISLTMKDPAQATARPARRKGGPRRKESRRSEDTQLLEDETPKEMTVLGEALRAAFAAEEEADKKQESPRRKKKQSVRSKELAELHRRTLAG